MAESKKKQKLDRPSGLFDPFSPQLGMSAVRAHANSPLLPYRPATFPFPIAWCVSYYRRVGEKREKKQNPSLHAPTSRLIHRSFLKYSLILFPFVMVVVARLTRTGTGRRNGRVDRSR